MSPTPLQLIATVLFAGAVIHTFLVKRFEHVASSFPQGSVGENLFHFLAEVEVVFGLWAGLFIVIFSLTEGINEAIHYLEGLNFTEPVFVFVIMTMAATRPVILMAQKLIELFSKLVPANPRMSFYIAALIVGPLLGSFITEPAAMTVTAIILLKYFYLQEMSDLFKYATLGLLFVNISIGGTLTHFAAPPVLMVAQKWHWDIQFMLTHFGYKSAIAIFFSTLIVAFLFKKELKRPLNLEARDQEKMTPPLWVSLLHILFLVLVVMTSHHTVFFLGLFLFFLGFLSVTKEYQRPVKLVESLLVGFFLAGLVTLGSMQEWWLKDVLQRLGDVALFFGATGLTAITDNAALTYLGSLVELDQSAKYFLVAGAVAGGGLTVIANAPNPAGFGILREAFGKKGISPIGLLTGALFPTAVALAAFYLLPSIG